MRRCNQPRPEARSLPWSKKPIDAGFFCARPLNHKGKHRDAEREWEQGARYSLPREAKSGSGSNCKLSHYPKSVVAEEQCT